MADPDEPAALARLTTDIVTAYVGHHTVAAGDVARLIAVVGRGLGGLGREPEQPATPEPAVPVRRSVQRDHLVCLVCGKRFKSLRRHLATAHGLTPASYREMFGLKPDYPMLAPASSEQRAEIAKRTGLGRRPQPEPAPGPQPARPKRVPRASKRTEVATTPEAEPKPKRRPRAAPRTEPTPS